MKKVIKFISNDGKEFNTMKDCKDWETLCEKIKKIMGRLPDAPENNRGMQHEKTLFLSVRKELLLLMKTVCDHHWVDDTINNINLPNDRVGRLIDDIPNLSCFSHAWFRIYSTSKSYKEYSQPYYAINELAFEL